MSSGVFAVELVSWAAVGFVLVFMVFVGVRVEYLSHGWQESQW
jgi:uncharacterized membrane protein YjfL (UPF0719 family)